MDDGSQRHGAGDLATTADRFDALADTADLMGDADTARRWRELASGLRLQAMGLLDADPS